MRAVSGTARAGAVRLGRALVAMALVAQLAHAVIYGSVFPAGGAHQYFGWYVPLVVALSAGALALVPVSIAAGALTGGRVSFSTFLPERSPDAALGAVARLAVASALFLLVQESIERSAVSGGLHVATFSPLTLVVAAVVLAVAAATVVAVERTLDGLAERGQVACRPRHVAHRSWSAQVARLPRRRPESTHGGLRAPPLLV
jgi:hypothetical protein